MSAIAIAIAIAIADPEVVDQIPEPPERLRRREPLRQAFEAALQPVSEQGDEQAVERVEVVEDQRAFDAGPGGDSPGRHRGVALGGIHAWAASKRVLASIVVLFDSRSSAVGVRARTGRDRGRRRAATPRLRPGVYRVFPPRSRIAGDPRCRVLLLDAVPAGTPAASSAPLRSPEMSLVATSAANDTVRRQPTAPLSRCEPKSRLLTLHSSGTGHPKASRRWPHLGSWLRLLPDGSLLELVETERDRLFRSPGLHADRDDAQRQKLPAASGFGEGLGVLPRSGSMPAVAVPAFWDG